MAVSRTPGRDRPTRRTDAGRLVPSRYDLALLAIPALFAVALVSHAWFGVPVEASLVFASGLSAGVVGDVLLRNPPTGPGSDAH